MPLNVRQYSKTDYDTATNLKATCNLGIISHIATEENP